MSGGRRRPMEGMSNLAQRRGARCRTPGPAYVHPHTLIGELILHAAPALWYVAPIMRSSHERFAASSAPTCSRGIHIPVAARIVFVCDARAAAPVPPAAAD